MSNTIEKLNKKFPLGWSFKKEDSISFKKFLKELNTYRKEGKGFTDEHNYYGYFCNCPYVSPNSFATLLHLPLYYNNEEDTKKISEINLIEVKDLIAALSNEIYKLRIELNSINEHLDKLSCPKYDGSTELSIIGRIDKLVELEKSLEQNKSEQLQENLESVHLYLDDLKISRMSGNQTLSINGRIKHLLKLHQEEISALESSYLKKENYHNQYFIEEKTQYVYKAELSNGIYTLKSSDCIMVIQLSEEGFQYRINNKQFSQLKFIRK